MLATPFGRLDGLAIDTAGAGGWLPTGSPPDSPSEGVIDGLPDSVSFPRRKVVVDGPPWGKIVGQRSPDTAIAVAVEDGINHGPHLGLAWPPTGAGRRQEGLQDSPLLACQITGVWLRVHTLSTFETPLLEQTLTSKSMPDPDPTGHGQPWSSRRTGAFPRGRCLWYGHRRSVECRKHEPAAYQLERACRNIVRELTRSRTLMMSKTETMHDRLQDRLDALASRCRSGDDCLGGGNRGPRRRSWPNRE